MPDSGAFEKVCGCAAFNYASGLRKSTRTKKLAAAVVSSLLSLSCASYEITSSEGLAEKSSFNLENRDQPVGETWSPYALEIRWDGAAGGKQAGAFAAAVENTTDNPIKAEVVLVVHAPDGQIAEQPLETREFQARETAQFSIPVSSFPLQSSGVASGAMLEVRYESANATLEDPSKVVPLPVVNRSATVFVMHSDDFASARIRSVTEEATLNGELRRNGKPPQIGEIRGQRARQQSKEALSRGPVMTIMRLPANSPMSPTPPVGQVKGGAP